LLKNFFLISLPIVLIDLITKKIVKSTFSYGESVKIIGNFLRFTYIENPGIAFGLFADHHPLKNLILFIIAIFAIFFIIFTFKNSKTRFQRISLSIILGGALGNVLERLFGYIIYFGDFKIFYGKVVDFIDIGIGELRWPYFNIADSSITIGVIMLMIYYLFFENKINKKVSSLKDEWK